jgi:hypothetical protein
MVGNPTKVPPVRPLPVPNVNASEHIAQEHASLVYRPARSYFRKYGMDSATRSTMPRFM